MLDFNPIQMGLHFTLVRTDGDRAYLKPNRHIKTADEVTEDMIEFFKTEDMSWVPVGDINWYLDKYGFEFDDLGEELQDRIYTELNVY